jgi:hypothetical protein
MRRVRPAKTKGALEELLMGRLRADPVCAGISTVFVNWLPRSGPEGRNWYSSLFRQGGGLSVAALAAAEKISRQASAEFDLEE